MKVLVADVDRKTRASLERLLMERRHAVAVASDGGEAVALARDERPDIVVADLAMPTPDGLTLMGGIKGLCQRRGCSSPYLIALVHGVRKDDIMTQLAAGADDILFKPVDPELLDARLKVASWTLNPLAGDGGEQSPDPLAVFSREHSSVEDILLILDTIASDLDKGVPEYVLTWASSTTLLVDMELHEEKEERYISIFIDKVVSSHGAQLAELSQSVFTQINDEHRRVEDAIRGLQAGVAEYLAADRGALAEFKKKLMKEPTCGISECDEREYLQYILAAASEHAAKRREAASRLRAAIRRYVDLLKPHLRMEEDAFFPLTQKYLDDGDNARIVEEFAKVDERLSGEGVARHLEEARRLAEAIRKGKSIPQRSPPG